IDRVSQDGLDAFEAPRHQNDRSEDIEMGIQRPIDSGELGLDDFFKQVQQIEKQYEKLEKLLKKLQLLRVEVYVGNIDCYVAMILKLYTQNM
ncbi:hypothetical protein EJD97_001208, partial [Solanum chilense]